MAGLLHRAVRGDVSIPPATALQRYKPTEPVGGKELKCVAPESTDRYAAGHVQAKPLAANDLGPNRPSATVADPLADPSARDLDDLDLCDGGGAGWPPGWIVALPEWGPCTAHGHGYWWESRHDGLLRCVGCWPNPPIRSLVARVWQSADGAAPVLAGLGFARGQTVLVCGTGDYAKWPWQDNQPAEPAFV